MSDRIAELISDGAFLDRVGLLPRLACVALAARAARYAQEVLNYELRFAAENAAAEHLLRRCEELAQRGGVLAPDPNDESSVEIFNVRRQNSPRPAVWEAVSSIGAACCCAAAGALDPARFSAWHSVMHARNAWLQGLISPGSLGVLGLEQIARPGVKDKLIGLVADTEFIRDQASAQRWIDETTVPRDFWGPRP